MTPRARTVCGLVAGLGLLAVVVLLLKPVRASFDDDPILRLQAFDRPVGALPTEVDCGSALSAIRGSSAPASLYTIARDEACHEEGYRRLVAAIAAGTVVVVLTLLLLVGSRASDEPAPRRRPRRYEPTQAAWAKAGDGKTAEEGEPGQEREEAPALTPAEEGR